MTRRKNKQSKSQRSTFPPAPVPPRPIPREPEGLLSWRALGGNPRRWLFLLLFIAVAAGGSWLVALRFRATPVAMYTFRVVAEYPHDPLAFTQGLWIDEDGYVYESTGKEGESRIRKYALGSDQILQERRLPDEYFGEGLTRFDGKFYQLTWKNRKVFVYDEDFNLLQELEYDGEGWGLTHDESHLILSDGTAKLRFLDATTLTEVRAVWVRQGPQYITQLNELEKIGKKVYANRLFRDMIYDIDPATGEVQSIIDLDGLWPHAERPREGVLNGIAFNSKTQRMIVTGKYCPKLFELELILKDR